MHRATLPPRVWVVGPCGSGKSTVATRLAERMGIDATHLDEIHWKPGWIESTLDEDRARVDEIVARPRWVIDGNYGNLRGPHLDRVELFVWLDLPLTVTWTRLLRRGLTRSIRRQSCCNGNYESLLRTFFDKDSLLLYSLQTHERRRKRLEVELAERPHVRLRTPGAVAQWLKGATAVSGEARPSRS